MATQPPNEAIFDVIKYSGTIREEQKDLRLVPEYPRRKHTSHGEMIAIIGDDKYILGRALPSEF